MLSLDRLDAALLAELTDNPRAGIVDLSAKLGVARNTIQSRIRKLEESGAGTGTIQYKLRAQSQEDLLQVLERIHSIEGVAHTTTTLALTTPVAYRTQPLLDHLTRGSGHGRSTPVADLP